jgi:hypothetical protein
MLSSRFLFNSFLSDPNVLVVTLNHFRVLLPIVSHTHIHQNLVPTQAWCQTAVTAHYNHTRVPTLLSLSALQDGSMWLGVEPL